MNEHDPAMERARTRARQLRELYGHLVTYVVVSGLLVAIDVAGGTGESTFIGLDWAFWPIIGWGIFVVMHIVRVMLPMDTWEDRKAEELYEKEQQRQYEKY